MKDHILLALAMILLMDYSITSIRIRMQEKLLSKQFPEINFCMAIIIVCISGKKFTFQGETDVLKIILVKDTIFNGIRAIEGNWKVILKLILISLP